MSFVVFNELSKLLFLGLPDVVLLAAVGEYFDTIGNFNTLLEWSTC